MHNKWYRFQFVIAINPILIFDKKFSTKVQLIGHTLQMKNHRIELQPHMNTSGSGNSHLVRHICWQLSCLLHIAFHFVNVARRGITFLLSQLFWTGFRSDTPSSYYQRSSSSGKYHLYSCSCQAPCLMFVGQHQTSPWTSGKLHIAQRWYHSLFPLSNCYYYQKEHL